MTDQQQAADPHANLKAKLAQSLEGFHAKLEDLEYYKERCGELELYSQNLEGQLTALKSELHIAQVTRDTNLERAAEAEAKLEGLVNNLASFGAQARDALRDSQTKLYRGRRDSQAKVGEAEPDAVAQEERPKLEHMLDRLKTNLEEK